MEDNEKKMSVVNSAQLKMLRINEICSGLSTYKIRGDMDSYRISIDCLYTELIGLLSEEEKKQAEQGFRHVTLLYNQHAQAPDSRTKQTEYLNYLRNMELWLRTKLIEHGLETVTAPLREVRNE